MLGDTNEEGSKPFGYNMNLKDIWGRKTHKSRSKVKWDFVTLPSGGLGIINPKAQCEALLAKLLMRGLP
jgi:hypothetical protein